MSDEQPVKQLAKAVVGWGDVYIFAGRKSGIRIDIGDGLDLRYTTKSVWLSDDAAEALYQALTAWHAAKGGEGGDDARR